MTIEVHRADDFLTSATTSDLRQTADADVFLEGRAKSFSYTVEQVPLDSLPGWFLDDRLAHDSGRFFTVEGLDVRTNFGPLGQWQQPVIVQSEIGILGILAKRINGVYHFLMQAKMEPGNSNFVQYATTVQATPSNYQRVHGGRPTPYLEYFLDNSRRRIIVDQLLSEHASWYLHKRNRNMIVEVPPDEDVPVEEDFTWLTLGQLRDQLARGNRVNMNARTVLACISYASAGDPDATIDEVDDFHSQVVRSHRTGRSDADVAAAMTWLIEQKSRFNLDVKRIDLGAMTDWVYEEGGFRHLENRYFRFVGMSVTAASREVATWSQPMLEPVPGNIVAFLCQRRAGVLEFLVQAMVQPGLTDRVELAATIQFTPGSYREPEDFPPLAEYVDPPDSWIRLRVLQSEDGGRFLRADTTHLVVQVPEDHRIEAPANYRWMSIGLLNRLLRSGYYLNVEVRSLLACLL